MPKARKFSVHGPAAGEYVCAQEGVVPQTDDERALRIATLVHVTMQTRPESAAALVKLVAREGLAAAAKVCTARRSP